MQNICASLDASRLRRGSLKFLFYKGASEPWGVVQQTEATTNNNNNYNRATPPREIEKARRNSNSKFKKGSSQNSNSKGKTANVFFAKIFQKAVKVCESNRMHAINPNQMTQSTFSIFTAAHYSYP